MQYRRANIAGATYFITANLAERGTRGAILLTKHIGILRDALRHVKSSHPFHIDAMVVLPDHFHLLMTLPPDDANFSTRIGAIKSAFSRQHPKTELIRASRESKRERGIWQRRFWEHLIRDDRDYANHVNYIHINPVKHGYVQRAVDWPHSTIHIAIVANRFINKGIDPYSRTISDQSFWVSNFLEVVQRRNYCIELDRYWNRLLFFERNPEKKNVVSVSISPMTVLLDCLARIIIRKTSLQKKLDGVMKEVRTNWRKPIRSRKSSCNVILKTITNGG